MSDYQPPAPVLHPFQLKALKRETQKAFDGWLERVNKNGHRDTEALGFLVGLAGELRMLDSIERSYLS